MAKTIVPMAKKNEIAKAESASIQPLENIENLIHVIRGKQVMLDRDLARLYGVETKRLNQQVQRNLERFPGDFMFQLNKEEFENWKSQFATSNSDESLRSQFATSTEEENWKSQFATSNSIKMGARKLPYAFTENGVAMLSGVLRSPQAIRFLCIDDTVYHIGASLKDLGKKWFAFSIMNTWTTDELLSKM